MRLTNREKKLIKKAFFEIFGDGEVYLFGSRVDDTKRGGDIDLYVIPENRDKLSEKKIEFLIKLKEYIGEQKIDVVVSRDKNRSIEKEALGKGVNLMDSDIKLQKYLKECEKHVDRIEKSYLKVKDIFPISSIKYQNLSDEEIGAIDQYLFRFSKLQDTLGGKVFKLIVSKYVDDVNRLTFIDILNSLEKIGILQSATLWKRLRDIRNEISHAYDDEPEEMAEALNNIIAQKDVIIAIYYNIADLLNQKNQANIL